MSNHAWSLLCLDEIISKDADINTNHGGVNSNVTSCDNGHAPASQTADSNGKPEIADSIRGENYNDNAVQSGGHNQNAKPSSSSDDSDSSSDDSDSDSEVSECVIRTEHAI